MRIRSLLALLLSVSLLESANAHLRSTPVVCSIRPGTWTLEQNGTTGVGAMELAVVSPNLVLILDKVEHNPMEIDGKPAWGSLFNLATNQASPLAVISNSFCAGGTHISNGTLVSVGGNGVILPELGVQDGFQGIRLFGPCNDTSKAASACKVYEDPKNLHLAKTRWYPSAIRIWDGSAMVMGGTTWSGFYNPPQNNTASYEFFPKRRFGPAFIPSPFLNTTAPSNLFPIAFSLPDGTVFIAANNRSIIYNIDTNGETILPPFPNKVRVTYPFTAGATPSSPIPSALHP